MKRRRRRIGQRLRNKLLAPGFGKIASELDAPGEEGRALPGMVQAQMRAAAKKPQVTPDVPASVGRTEISTRFTKETGSTLLYQAEGWVRVRLMLETAGPVAVGTRDDVAPPLSGKGILLPIDVEITFPMQKGGRIFLAATSVNRVRFIVEPIPWYEQIAAMLGKLVAR
jgi:hypothetical protein